MLDDEPNRISSQGVVERDESQGMCISCVSREDPLRTVDGIQAEEVLALRGIRQRKGGAGEREDRWSQERNTHLNIKSHIN